MAGSQDSEKRETAQGEPVRRKAQCKDRSLERSVAEPGAGAGGRGGGREGVPAFNQDVRRRKGRSEGWRWRGWCESVQPAETGVGGDRVGNLLCIL